MQSTQIRLSKNVSDRRVTFSTCKPSSNTIPEQQSLVLTSCKPPHQYYHWERHSWYSTDEVASDTSLPMTQGSAYMSFSRPERRYQHNQAHKPVSIFWQSISHLSEPEIHKGLTWRYKLTWTQWLSSLVEVWPTLKSYSTLRSSSSLASSESNLK